MVVLRLGHTPAALCSAMGGWTMSGSCSRTVTGSGSLRLDRLGTGIGSLQAGHEGGFAFAGSGGGWAMMTAEHCDG
jgi:hypothetical protein